MENCCNLFSLVYSDCRILIGGFMAEQVVTILSNFGFPICITLLLLYYIKTEQTKTNEQLQNIEKTIERNTTIIEIYLKKEDIHER